MPSYRGYRFPPEIISHAVWLYHRFSLSFRDVEDLLAERGITVTYETIRRWCLTFGIDYARRLGIESPLNRDLSLALGSSDLSLLEMSRAFAVFPNGGRRVEPRFITKVTDADGNVLMENVLLGNQLPPLENEAGGEQAGLAPVAAAARILPRVAAVILPR